MPNPRLRALLHEARWTGSAFARALSDCAAENGLPTRFDRTSVSHWLAGRRPSPPAPRLMAEILARRLHRAITAADLGLAEPEDATPPWWEAGVLGQLDHVHDLGGRGPGSDVYSVAVAAAVATTRRAPLPSPVDDGPRLDACRIRAAEHMLTVLSEADVARGGGHIRQAATGYLATHVKPMLTAPGSAKRRASAQLIAGRIAYLCGFASFDVRRHAEAQRYYLIARGLAADAGDVRLHAFSLRQMSVQAHDLGHHALAHDLAESAVALAGPGVDGTDRAFLMAQLAVTAAGVAGPRAAMAALRACERALDGRPDARRAIGNYHRAALAHTEALVRGHLGEPRAATTALRASILRRPPIERRARVLSLARLGGLHLSQGHLGSAVEAWNTFMEEAPHIDSRRVDAALAQVRASLRSHPNDPGARALLRRMAGERRR
ncbi:hypothetical protein Afil01_27260 [Actinorhabdospora filicis]|uniref:Transcriptional regulator n=2 Tax=Actinorhabdospora filicis TaxID=1785913 RepID=A0A9W6SLH1_9ACTN|nr:hypothetical protein Afil01_27260 [Actinorhabdospora filicis]